MGDRSRTGEGPLSRHRTRTRPTKKSSSQDVRLERDSPFISGGTGHLDGRGDDPDGVRPPTGSSPTRPVHGSRDPGWTCEVR